MLWPGTLLRPSIVRLRLIDGVLMEAMVKGIRVDEIGVKACKKIAMFEWALCKVVMSLLPDCIVGVDIASPWGMFPLLGIVKQGT